MELTVGQSFGDYEILGVLGAGGMGKVYKVRNKISNRVEAMKILLSDLNSEPETVSRFTREIRIFGSLHHPNIAELRTALRVDNQLVMIMEFVEGSSLDALMKQGRIPIDKVLDCMCQALSALSYAHSQGVIHRDIKPANMMLTPTGVLKLMDFGIAKAVTDPKLTRVGMVVGSIYYVPPEQIEGKESDSRADLYSLGVTLYELATGKRPFNGNTDYEIITAHLKENPPPPRELDQSLPKELNDIILLALEKDPAQRFQTADAFRNALSSVLDTLRPVPAGVPAGAPATTPFAPPPSYKPKRNNRLLYMLAGSAATLAVIVGAIVELPKLMHTSAAGQKVEVPQTTAPPAMPKPVEQAPVEQAPAEHAPVTQAPVAVQVDKTPEKVPAGPVAKPMQQRAIQQQAVAQAPAIAQPQPPPQVQTAPVQTAPAQAPPIQAPPPQVSAEVEQLREQANLIGIRVGTVRAAFQNLQRQQAASGLSPRSDMVAADQRIGYQMDQAEASLRQGDAVGAKKRLDSAERDLEKLERFLGK
jgi:serine/threonine-protein kinase